MKLVQAVKPIGYVKANMAEIIRKISEDGQPIVITQNGEAKAVLISIEEWDRMHYEIERFKAPHIR